MAEQSNRAKVVLYSIESSEPGAFPGQCHFLYLISHLKIPTHTPAVLPRHRREYSPPSSSYEKLVGTEHSPIHVGDPALEEISQLHLEK